MEEELSRWVGSMRGGGYFGGFCSIWEIVRDPVKGVSDPAPGGLWGCCDGSLGEVALGKIRRDPRSEEVNSTRARPNSKEGKNTVLKFEPEW